MLPDLIKICSAVSVDGISKSYSDIFLPAHLIDFGRFSNFVSIFTSFSFKAPAKVKVLNTEPNS